VGTRPQFIKVAPVSRAIASHNSTGSECRIEHRIVNTGQHYDFEMADLILQQIGIPAPHHTLGVGSGSHGKQLARLIEGLEPVLDRERPDWVIVYGDTNSALAGALTAARLNLRVAHVEAGCRSFNGGMPEEQNRVLIDHLSQLLLAPTRSAVANLLREGIGGADDPQHRTVTFVGDVMYDALRANQEAADMLAAETLQQLCLQPNEYYLLTLHRAENTIDAGQVLAILDLLESLPLPVLFPAHPRTLQLIGSAHQRSSKNVRTIPPLGYLQMLAVGKRARKIITDSGGVQKEAFYLQVPCITLRHETEWPETLERGANRLVGTDSIALLDAIHDRPGAFDKNHAPFGNGNSSALIVDQLLSSFPKRSVLAQ
jgi:UDP-N-acetylglucosamine 2-epimerase